MKSLKKIKSIHFVGIKGVGMTPLAIIAKEAGLRVTGSDVREEFITDKSLKEAGIIPFVGFSSERIVRSDLVITTGAHGGYENVEVKAAREKYIPVLTQGEAIGVFMNGGIFKRKFVGISIAGSHGKTTTAAMLATIFKQSGYDPSYLIGTSSVSSLGFPGHYGKGIFFIAEADEYATEPSYDKTPKFLWQYPKIIIITNIELDHPDLYASVGEVRNAFQKFVRNIASDGNLIACGDDPQTHKLIRFFDGNVITFGFSVSNSYVIKRVIQNEFQTRFRLESYGTILGEFAISIPGEHNILNATGAIIAALKSGVSIEKINKSLQKYKGSKRRFEYIGKTSSGALLYDDYAHHPTEIKKTLQALRNKFPKSRIICIFQPHTYSRTKIMFEQFSSSFKAADIVVLSNIYPSMREKKDDSVSSKRLVKSIGRQQKQAIFLPRTTDVVEYIDHLNPCSDTVIISMGAGDIYKIHKELKQYE